MRGRFSLITSLVLALLMLGGLMWATGAQAHFQVGGMSLPAPLVIDEEAHHLGDQTVSFFDIPAPEGTVYSVTFTLPASAVQDSYLRLETYNVESNNPVQLNGVEIEALPGTWWIGWQPVVFPVPASALQVGENTLVISSVRFAQWQIFEHWYDDLMFRNIELLASQTSFQDEFDSGSLQARWDWVDLQEDCSYNLTDTPGFLTVEVPGSPGKENGHDLFWLINFNAPRLLQPVRGDFLIETRLNVEPQENYQAAGLLVWQDTWHYVRLERNAWGKGGIFGGLHSSQGVPWTFRPTSATQLELRLSRMGNTFTGWYREVGASTWLLLGQATAPFSDTVLVGLAVYNQWSEQPTSAEFDYFHISRAVPPILTTPCGTTNQVRPVIRGRATAGAKVRLYADGAQVGTANATTQGDFAVSPTADLSSGPHTLTATVVNGGEESPPSPALNLMVKPDETIDFIGVTITHAPLFGNGPLITDFLRNGHGCAACDGTGFNVWVPGGKPITVSLPISATGVTSVEVRINDIGYPLADADSDGVYEGTFTPPSIRGMAGLEFVVYRAGGLVVEYSCGEIIIDPYGVVYDATVGTSAPIPGAVVTLYQQDPNDQKWYPWSPVPGETNPQTTGSDGKYSFNVPEGMYYLTVEATNYMSYVSQPIQVDATTGPVELLIPLEPNIEPGGEATKVYLPLIIK